MLLCAFPLVLTLVLVEQSYNPEAHVELMEFLDRHSLNDGDKFLASLMRESSRHKSLGKAQITSFSVDCHKKWTY